MGEKEKNYKQAYKGQDKIHESHMEARCTPRTIIIENEKEILKLFKDRKKKTTF